MFSLSIIVAVVRRDTDNDRRVRFGKWYARCAAEALRRAVRAAPIPRAFGQLRNFRHFRASSPAQVAVVFWRDDRTRVRPCALSVAAVDSPGR